MPIRRLISADLHDLVALRSAVDEQSPGPLGHPIARCLANSLEAVDLLLADASVFTVGAFEEGSLVGAASTQPTPGDARWYGLFGVAVLARARGTGIGRALVEACLEHVEHVNSQGMVLDLNRPNPYAEQLYVSLGFSEWADPAPSYTFEGVQYVEVHMRKQLSGA